MADVTYASYLENEQNRQMADDLAKQEYQRTLAQTGREDLALKQAQQAWKQKMDEAGLTGMYQGAPTVPYLQQSAETFGTWGAPTAGQQTLGAQQQQWQQAYNTANQYGQYYGTGQAPAVGTQTQSAQEQAYTQWLRAQQQQLAEQSQQQQAANQYLTLLSSMRGPQNYFQYQNVLGSTPQGMQDLVGAAMGKFVPGGGATTGVQPVAQSLQGLYGDVTGQRYGAQPAQQPNVAAFTPQGSVAQATQPAAQYQYSPTATGSLINQSGWAGASGQPTQGQNALGNGTNTMGAPQNASSLNLPAPNQVAMQSWNNLAPSQKSLLTSGWEASGWNADDVQALMNQSLPKYGSNAATAGTWRLR